MHPADEIAAIRAQIKTLKSQEAALRRQFIAGKLPLSSNRHHVQIRTQRRKTFLHDNLPAEILANPSYWEERSTQVVTVQDAALAGDTAEDIVLVVPFDD